MRLEDKVIQYLDKWFKENKNYKYQWTNSKLGKALKKNLIESGNWKRKSREPIALPKELNDNKIKPKFVYCTSKDFEDFDQ